MARANGHRGEVTIRLGGQNHVMRPTYQALAEIEAGTGKGIVTLAAAVGSVADLSVTDLVAIIAAGLRAGSPEYAITNDRVGEMVVSAGITSPAVIGAVNEFLIAALTGGVSAEDAAGKAAAAEG